MLLPGAVRNIPVFLWNGMVIKHALNLIEMIVEAISQILIAFHNPVVEGLLEYIYPGISPSTPILFVYTFFEFFK